MTYRTLKEATALRDHSNETLRFNRTLERGEWADDSTPGGFLVMLGAASVAGVVIWGLLILLFSVVTP